LVGPVEGGEWPFSDLTACPRGRRYRVNSGHRSAIWTISIMSTHPQFFSALVMSDSPTAEPLTTSPSLVNRWLQHRHMQEHNGG
jgi:hypothetical protein